MGKSTENELSELHGAIARVMTQQVLEEITITDEEGNVQTIMNASPALLGVAAKFLKDNNVTASIEDDENLGELAESLRQKRAKRGLRLAGGTEL